MAVVRPVPRQSASSAAGSRTRSDAERETLLTFTVASLGLLAVMTAIVLGLAGVVGPRTPLVVGLVVAVPVTVAQGLGLRRLSRSA